MSEHPHSADAGAGIAETESNEPLTRLTPCPAAAPNRGVAPAAKVAQVHAEIDRQTRSFAEATGLACPQGCGACCLSPDVETSVADLMPLAEELVRRGETKAMLERLEVAGVQCVLYEPHSDDPKRGRCTMYENRPSICRLFGFAGWRDKADRPRFTPCYVHGQVLPKVTAMAREAAEERRIALPIMSDLARQIAALAPTGQERLQPINEALREALRGAALAHRLAASTGASDDDDDGAPPTTPPRPRRAA
jgi:Fe-S-cluster containining protein